MSHLPPFDWIGKLPSPYDLPSFKQWLQVGEDARPTIEHGRNERRVPAGRFRGSFSVWGGLPQNWRITSAYNATLRCISPYTGLKNIIHRGWRYVCQADEWVTHCAVTGPLLLGNYSYRAVGWRSEECKSRFSAACSPTRRDCAPCSQPLLSQVRGDICFKSFRAVHSHMDSLHPPIPADHNRGRKAVDTKTIQHLCVWIQQDRKSQIFCSGQTRPRLFLGHRR